ncbi:MipA/OmpV family protein [Rhodomicrobium lacus]|uniref:MipA/OmpV family protein n=1 Tax=Rhodomicrobium lacus TaxID=2498452 RepID=UPI0026E2CD1E|nr:MipA/OmpV family protein [Rhodomicrobium lacus]WKW52095.1 MipA/OmpV family protein [Rhodomicrobium lacus]
MMMSYRAAVSGVVFAVCAVGSARAVDAPHPVEGTPSVWIVELGGYGVFEPTYLGSRRYGGSFKPQIDIREAGDKEWLSFPNDAFDYSLYETNNFRAGPAADISLQSRLHGQDIDLHLGKADVTLQGGAFFEYYPLDMIRTRVELLQGINGNLGFATNLSADYIWQPREDLVLTLGPRAQIVNDRYASDYFSTQIAFRHHNTYVPYRAEGGLLSSGGEFTSKYDLTSTFSAKFFLDYTQLMGPAADSPRVDLKGASEQVIVGIGGSYKFDIHQ